MQVEKSWRATSRKWEEVKKNSGATGIEKVADMVESKTNDEVDKQKRVECGEKSSMEGR